MLIPREGSLRLAASGSLRIVCEPSTVNLAWNLIFGITLQTCGRRSARSRSRCQSRIELHGHGHAARQGQPAGRRRRQRRWTRRGPAREERGRAGDRRQRDRGARLVVRAGRIRRHGAGAGAAGANRQLHRSARCRCLRRRCRRVRVVATVGPLAQAPAPRAIPSSPTTAPNRTPPDHDSLEMLNLMRIYCIGPRFARAPPDMFLTFTSDTGKSTACLLPLRACAQEHE